MIVPMTNVATNNKTVGDNKLNHNNSSDSTDPVIIFLCSFVIKRSKSILPDLPEFFHHIMISSEHSNVK